MHKSNLCVIKYIDTMAMLLCWLLICPDRAIELAIELAIEPSSHRGLMPTEGGVTAFGHRAIEAGAQHYFTVPTVLPIFTYFYVGSFELLHVFTYVNLRWIVFVLR